MYISSSKRQRPFRKIYDVLMSDRPGSPTQDSRQPQRLQGGEG
jgi:hypothetical protein